MKEPGENPAGEIVRVDFRHVIQAVLGQVIRDRDLQELGPVVEGLGVGLGTLDELDLVRLRNPDIEDQAMRGPRDR